MKRILVVLLTLTGLAAAAAAVAASFFVTKMRSRDPRFLKKFTEIQRDYLNPEVLKNAGTPGQRTAVIETIGRTSGAAYETPISPVRDDEGWSVALVYGRDTAWAKNAMAAGEAVLRIDGERHRVDQIEIVPIADTILASDQEQVVKFFKLEDAVRLHDAGVIEDATLPEEPAPVEG
ncbi:hypothetical protein GCM10009808_19740 [Microbacterium sediminicola]|uniref:Nitroreductase family deazaflavin-dependent oxidoreductase n=1 Tax=Microbacterium sediminicola TaxID=415210 RepID=A0ABN2IBW8_9MICO